MKLYNTLTKKVQPLELLNPPIVSLYTCGPTVYDHAHIGNLRTFIFDDTLRRVLELVGYDVRHVMNVTDVGHLVSDADEGDDKLEKGAKREHKSVWEVADAFTNGFKADIDTLNILVPNAYHDKKRADTYARATDFINEQIAIIKALFEKNYVYQTEQAIYFDTSKLAV